MWRARGHTVEHAMDADVFIHVRPVDAAPLTYQAVVVALNWRCVRQTP
jgi:hypothetical protein